MQLFDAANHTEPRMITLNQIELIEVLVASVRGKYETPRWQLVEGWGISERIVTGLSSITI